MSKNKKLTQKEICDKWLANKNINPETLRKIKENGDIYIKLAKKCSLNQKEICDRWLANKNINPETLRKIKNTGAIYKKLEKECLSNSEVKSKSEPKSISEGRKKEAINKIHKLFVPYIKRTSINVIDRINYFVIMKKYMLSIKETKNCVRLYNIDEKTKKPIYRVGNRIILDKQIGTDSVYGIVFLSHFKTNIRYGTKFDKLNKFAVKITNQTKENKNEVKVLEDLTKQVIELQCPHFPITYGHLRCNNSRAKSDNLDDYSIIKDKHNKKKLFPKLINKNKSLLIQINELASGDLNNYLKSNPNKNISNVFVQIFLSLMFFNDYTKSYHYDPHTGNFLYHIVKPGGYFHYNIYGNDYYLENQGTLWVIWDFGLIKPFTENNKYGPKYDLPINIDYDYILDAMKHHYNILSPDARTIREQLEIIVKKYNKITDYKLLKKINKELLTYLIKNVQSFTTIKPSNIINKNPYIIGSKSSIKTSYFSSIVNYVKKRFYNKKPLI